MAERSSLVRLQEEYDIEVDWRGFELHPEIPPGGTELSAYVGHSRAAAFRAYLERFAADFGVPIDQPEHIPSTRRALAATEYARDQGRLEPFRDAVMEAHWARGRNIESDSALRVLAEQTGLDPDRLVQAAESPEYQLRIDAARKAAHDNQVSSIPTFLIGDIRIIGCQAYAHLRAAAEKVGLRPSKKPG